MHNFHSMQTNSFIHFTNVSVVKNSTLILKEVNFSIRKGDFVYLLGQTGSGKSSLLETIYAELPIQEGNIIVDQIPVHQITLNTRPYLRRKIGLVSTDFPLIPNASIEQNLDLVLHATSWTDPQQKATRIDQVLQLLEGAHLKNQKADQLTKKEYVKILIARALLNSPSILLLDAPTHHLDKQAAHDILQFIHQYNQEQKVTTIFATTNRELPVLFPSDSVLFCEQGCINPIT